MRPAVGDVFAGYRILGAIGADEMSETYLAAHPRFPRRDVLHLPAPALIDDDGAREEFVRRADTLSAVVHPNIVPVYDRGETDRCPWYATAHIDGGDLGELIADTQPERIATDTFVEIARPIADALDHAHEHGVVHGDLTTSAILFAGDRRRQVYLTGLRPAPRGVERPGAADREALIGLIRMMLRDLGGGVVDAVISLGALTAPGGRQTCRDVVDVLAVELAKGAVNKGADNVAPAAPATTVTPTAVAPTAVAPTAESPTVAAPGMPSPPPVAGRPAMPVPPMPTPGPVGFGPIRWTGYPGTVEQLRGLACGAFFAVDSGSDPVDHLMMAESDRQIRKIIRRAWAITDTNSAVETVELLTLGMVTPDYDAVLASLARTYPGAQRAGMCLDPDVAAAIAAWVGVESGRVQTLVQVAAQSRTLPRDLPVSTRAWELGQAVELVRMCRRAGLVDDAWAWAAIIDTGHRAQQCYADWTAFALGFEWGRALASAEDTRDVAAAADESCARTRPVLTTLLTDQLSPWLRIPLR